MSSTRDINHIVPTRTIVDGVLARLQRPGAAQAPAGGPVIDLDPAAPTSSAAADLITRVVGELDLFDGENHGGLSLVQVGNLQLSALSRESAEPGPNDVGRPGRVPTQAEVWGFLSVIQAAVEANAPIGDGETHIAREFIALVEKAYPRIGSYLRVHLFDETTTPDDSPVNVWQRRAVWFRRTPYIFGTPPEQHAQWHEGEASACHRLAEWFRRHGAGYADVSLTPGASATSTTEALATDTLAALKQGGITVAGCVLLEDVRPCGVDLYAASHFNLCGTFHSGTPFILRLKSPAAA